VVCFWEKRGRLLFRHGKEREKRKKGQRGMAGAVFAADGGPDRDHPFFKKGGLALCNLSKGRKGGGEEETIQSSTATG